MAIKLYKSQLEPTTKSSNVENRAFASMSEAGSIGRRYARADEIGIFFSMTVDHQTLEDGTVTLRERDSKDQNRLSIEDALSKVRR